MYIYTDAYMYIYIYIHTYIQRLYREPQFWSNFEYQSDGV